MATILRIDPRSPSPTLIQEVVEVIRGGGVVIYPTETLYGLGVDPFHPQAVKRLYEIKGRDRGKPIPFLIKDLQVLADLVEEIPAHGRDLIERYWPGPLTLIFRAREGFPSPLRTGEGTIGLRISAHPIARMIVERLDTPLTSTSANRAGGEDFTDIEALSRGFGDAVDLIIDGGEVSGLGSTVVDLTVTPPKVLREGMIKRPW